MNYQPVTAGNQSNPSAGFQDKFDAEKGGEESDQQYVLFPVWSFGSTNPQNNDGDAVFNEKKPESEVNVSLSSKFEDLSDNSINEVNAAGTLVPTVVQISPNSTNTFSAAGPSNAVASPTHGKSSSIDAFQLPEYLDMPELVDITYSDDKDDVGAEADFNNLETCITVSPIPTTRAHKDHHVTQIIGDLSLATQIRSITRVAKDQGRLSQMLNDDFHTWSEDPDHPNNVYKVVKALYGLHQAPRAWYETLANYLLETDDIIFGETNKDLCKSFEKPMKEKFQISSMGELTFFLGLQVKQKKDGIFISHDKYVGEILRKFRLTDGKSASTPIDIEKPMLKDPDGEDVDVHTYRSMIGSLMYLTYSRPDIMFAVCAYARFKVTSKASHLHAVKRIFRYLKGRPHLGLWYLKDSPFDLVAYSDSDYAGASLDRKSITGGFQLNVVQRHILLDCIFLSFGLTMQVVLSGDNTPRCDEDRLELIELMVFLLPKVEKVGIGVSAVDLQVSAIRLMLLMVGKGFSGVKTPLFEGMLVEQQVAKVVAVEVHGEEVNDGDAAERDVSDANDEVPTVAEEPSIPSPTPPTLPPQPSHDIPSTS
nr:hypothetical protein [Tanacetum cinerariifolium]